MSSEAEKTSGDFFVTVQAKKSPDVIFAMTSELI